MIYLDNAATSWPKPPGVAQAMADFLEEAGGNPGRSGHRLSIEAGRIVYDARERIAELFNLSDPLRVIFTLNATHAINLALQGLLVAGDRIVTTAVEHNAVMRPLRSLEARGVEVSVMQCEPDGSLSLDQAGRSIRPGTKLVVATHANNVTGTLLPITAIAEMAHAAGASLLVDAAQTAGVFPIDIQRMGIDLLAFTGHKGLMGPPGTGGLILGERLNPAILQPLMRGGTGSRSEFELQPDDLPDKFEAGTPNSVGIAGLGASVAFVVDRGVEAIRAHEVGLTRALLRGLADLPTVRVYGPTNPTGPDRGRVLRRPRAASVRGRAEARRAVRRPVQGWPPLRPRHPPHPGNLPRRHRSACARRLHRAKRHSPHACLNKSYRRGVVIS